MNNLIAIHLERNGQTKTVLTEHQAGVWLKQGWTRLPLVLTKPGLPITDVLEDTSKGDDMQITKNGQTRTVGGPEAAQVYLDQGWTLVYPLPTSEEVAPVPAPIAEPEPEPDAPKVKKRK